MNQHNYLEQDKKALKISNVDKQRLGLLIGLQLEQWFVLETNVNVNLSLKIYTVLIKTRKCL